MLFFNKVFNLCENKSIYLKSDYYNIDNIKIYIYVCEVIVLDKLEKNRRYLSYKKIMLNIFFNINKSIILVIYDRFFAI